MHEGSHTFADLYDEYVQSKSAPAGTFRAYSNCVTDPGTSYSFGRKVYGRTDVVGCSALF